MSYRRFAVVLAIAAIPFALSACDLLDNSKSDSDKPPVAADPLASESSDPTPSESPSTRPSADSDPDDVTVPKANGQPSVANFCAYLDRANQQADTPTGLEVALEENPKRFRAVFTQASFVAPQEIDDDVLTMSNADVVDDNGNVDQDKVKDPALQQSFARSSKFVLDNC